MCVNEMLLEKLEELFELVANENDCEQLHAEMDSLREFLERDVDGWTNHTDETLAFEVQDRLEEIWNLITDQEKTDNHLLEDHYEDLMAELERICGYEIDSDDEQDCDENNGDDDCDLRENEEE